MTFARLDRDCGALGFSTTMPELVRYLQEAAKRIRLVSRTSSAASASASSSSDKSSGANSDTHSSRSQLGVA